MPSLAEAFQAWAAEQECDPPPISEEGLIANLEERFEAYCRWMMDGCPFNPGDLVTPGKGSLYQGAGEPHIVMEVRHLAQSMFPDLSRSDASNSDGFGLRLDMRVMRRSSRDFYPMYWVESFQFDPWHPKSDAED